MQSGGQYGLPDMQQFVLRRGAPHAFAHSQDVPPALHLHQHLHPQQQQHQEPQAFHQHQEPQAFHQHQHRHGVQPQQYDQHTRPPLQMQQMQQQPLNLHLHPHQKVQPSLQLPLLQHQGLGSESADTPSPLATQPPAGHFKPLISTGDPLGDDDEVADEGDRCAGNRWPRDETSALLRIRSDMDSIFRDSGSKVSLWEEVSRKLSELGYHRTAKKCKEKFENVHKYYKKTKDGRAKRQDGKSYRFFSELEALYTVNNDEGGASSEGGVAGTNMVIEHGGSVLLAAGEFPAVAVEGEPLPLQRQETSSGLNFSSTSSGDNYDEPQDIEDRKSRKKRKRKSWCSVKIFFENLARQAMEQQEALHKRFLDMVERRDQERLVKEEAFKRQEMARLNREHELRAQEHALAATRDAALVAFLQKVTGQTLQLPQIPVPPNVPTSSDFLDDQEKEGSDINTRRWPKAEVHALIRLRSGLEPRFQEAGPKAQLWEEISASMACMGFNRSAKRCKEKWENINKYFRKTKDSSKKRLDNAKTCPYFHQLETLYQKGVLASPNNKLNKLEGHSENLLENTKEDSEPAQIGNSATLIIVPFGENGAGCSTSSSQLCTNQEKAKGPDQVSKGFPESNANSQRASSPLSFDKFQSEDLSGCNKSLPAEGFVREILEIQQEQHQKLVDEYDRMERAREMSEQERRQQHEMRFNQEHSHSTIRENAGLMALVQKLAGDSSEFTMAAPSCTG